MLKLLKPDINITEFYARVEQFKDFNLGSKSVSTSV